jgi:DNA (cytosine-5)-methyltransferase 1
MVYYNEIDPYAAQWLRNLIAAGLIADGEVDERSIVDVRGSDLRGFRQCHFFAGIGGWSYALRLAGWPDDEAIWTGSCPCQPISVAGEGKAHEDERHLWPAFFGLIRECRPVVIVGEQVAGAYGLAWLDQLCADMEGIHYSAAAANLPACSVGAPHVRARLWWVAHANGVRRAEPRHSRQNTGHDAADAFRQANRLLDAVRSNALPLVCGEHDGIPASMGAMRAYGNAIVPQVAAEFIGAYMETRMDESTSPGARE